MDEQSNRVTVIDRRGGRYLISEPGGEPVLLDESTEVNQDGANEVSNGDTGQAGSNVWSGSNADGRG